MFRYFGRKDRLAKLYPRPRFDTIVEPFAGSAAYSTHADYWQKQVILVEKDPRIAELWRWLISDEVDADLILGLPAVQKGDPLPGSGPVHTFYQSAMTSAARFNTKTATSWYIDDWRNAQQAAAADIHKVKHWQIVEGDYSEAPDIEATWFIDPPYQRVVHGYGDSRDSIDFSALGEWTRNRRGQVIACDEIDADWLPFSPLSAHRTLNNTTKIEGVWLSEPDPGRLF